MDRVNVLDRSLNALLSTETKSNTFPFTLYKLKQIAIIPYRFTNSTQNQHLPSSSRCLGSYCSTREYTLLWGRAKWSKLPSLYNVMQILNRPEYPRCHELGVVPLRGNTNQFRTWRDKLFCRCIYDWIIRQPLLRLWIANAWKLFATVKNKCLGYSQQNSYSESYMCI